MPTLSFSCPKCNRLHERIKPEMVGHKVRCQCGFVFRLGSKTDKQAWFSKELKEKKARKKKLESNRPAPRKTPQQRTEDLFDLQPKPDSLDRGVPSAPHTNDFQYVDPMPSIDGLEIEPNPIAPLIDDSEDGRMRNHPVAKQLDQVQLAGRDTAIIHSIIDLPEVQNASFAQDESSYPHVSTDRIDPFAVVASIHHSSVAPPRRLNSSRTVKRKPGLPLNSPTGPVCSLVVMLIGVPGLIVVMFLLATVAIATVRLSNTVDQIEVVGAFGQSDESFDPAGSITGNLSIQLLPTIGLIILLGVLALTMIVSTVVSIVELANSVYIGWASKLSAIIASAVLACLVLAFCTSVYSVFQTANAIENAAGITIDKTSLGKDVSWLALRYCIYGIVPLAVMITGFARVMKR